jgi:hypothetical protein
VVVTHGYSYCATSRHLILKSNVPAVIPVDNRYEMMLGNMNNLLENQFDWKLDATFPALSCLYTGDKIREGEYNKKHQP